MVPLFIYCVSYCIIYYCVVCWAGGVQHVVLRRADSRPEGTVAVRHHDAVSGLTQSICHLIILWLFAIMMLWVGWLSQYVILSFWGELCCIVSWNHHYPHREPVGVFAYFPTVIMTRVRLVDDISGAGYDNILLVLFIHPEQIEINFV